MRSDRMLSAFTGKTRLQVCRSDWSSQSPVCPQETGYLAPSDIGAVGVCSIRNKRVDSFIRMRVAFYYI